MRSWFWVVVWMALIFFVSSQPAPELANEPILDLVLKKLAHATAYAILAVLLNFALNGIRSRRLGLPTPSWLAFAIAVAYAGPDEIHEAFVPTRHASAVDVMIDACGAAIAMLALARMRRSRESRPSE